MASELFGKDRIPVSERGRKTYDLIVKKHKLFKSYAPLFALAATWGIITKKRGKLEKMKDYVIMTSLKNEEIGYDYEALLGIVLFQMHPNENAPEQLLVLLQEYAEHGIAQIRKHFDKYRSLNFQRILEEIELETKKLPSNENTDSLEALEIIQQGEGKGIEFKSSLRWDTKRKIKNNKLEEVIAKTIAGFMNARGGILLIGVNDEGDILGIEHDYPELLKANRDGFQLRLREVFDEFIGIEFGDLIDIDFAIINNKEICIVKITESDEPIYLKRKDGTSDFVLRSGNRTKSLQPKAIEEYRKKRW